MSRAHSSLLKQLFGMPRGYPYMTVKPKHSIVVAREEGAAVRRATRHSGRKRLTAYVVGGLGIAGAVAASVRRIYLAKRI